MKKFFTLILVSLVSMLSYGQKTMTTTTTYTTTKTDYLNAQARIPQAYVQPIVMPLVTEVDVLKEFKSTFLVAGSLNKFRIKLTKKQVEKDLGGNLTDVHNYGVYLLSDDIGCDMIVAPIYNLASQDDGSYILEIKGFPANFKNWRTCNQNDYEWMKINGTLRLSTDPSIYTKINE